MRKRKKNKKTSLNTEGLNIIFKAPVTCGKKKPTASYLLIYFYLVLFIERKQVSVINL